MWAPGRIPAGTETDGLASTIDLLPTIAALTKTPLPEGLVIDGIDISSVIHGGNASPRNEFLYYRGTHAVGLRQGDWKLLIRGSKKGEPSETLLFKLSEDIGEKNDLAKDKPAIVERLRKRMKALDAEIASQVRPVWKKP